MFDILKEPKLSAKRLLKAVRSADPQACDRARAIIEDTKGLPNDKVHELFNLGRARHVVAKELGYESWNDLKKGFSDGGF